MDTFNKALSYAFLLLRFRPRAQEEVRRRLRKRNFSPYIVRKVITYLKDYKYLDDQEFVKSYLGTSLIKGWGPVRVGVNLRKLGISGKLREEAVEAAKKESDVLIKNLLERKVCFLKSNEPNLSKKKIKEKAVRFLANRGFLYKDIYKHLDEYLK